MEKVLMINKLLGQTPLEAIQELRIKNEEYKGVQLAYAGRLDPMAEGLLLILVGDECKNRDKYQDMEKEYEFEVLFGIETDTYDPLGKIQQKITNYELRDEQKLEIKSEELREIQEHRDLSLEIRSKLGVNVATLNSSLQSLISSFTGEVEQEYPPYSSMTVDGKPLWKWAREGRLGEIEIPKKLVNIKALELVGQYTITNYELRDEIQMRISKVKGDFRQEKILKAWDEFLKDNSGEFQVAKFKATVSSGTYVRSIAHEMGKKLGTGAIALSIKRTRVGDYNL